MPFCAQMSLMAHMQNKSKEPVLILASASPRRSQLLRQAGIAFEAIPSKAEEIVEDDPEDMVLRNAKLKAESVALAHPQRLVLGSDTTVALGRRTFGKPKDIGQAKQMLGELSGKTHTVYTAVALVKSTPSGLESSSGICASKVSFKKLDTAAIDRYLEKVNVLDKAGAYAAQECADMIIEKIEGPFDNVMGLPISTVKELLKNTNFQ